MVTPITYKLQAHTSCVYVFNLLLPTQCSQWPSIHASVKLGCVCPEQDFKLLRHCGELELTIAGTFPKLHTLTLRKIQKTHTPVHCMV